MADNAINFLIFLIIALVIIVLAILFYYYIVNNSMQVNATNIGYKVLNQSGLG
jgi:regulator of protease activity HflC (stomatin/prohibitin superfamily)